MKKSVTTVKKRIYAEGSRARQFLFSGGNYITLVLACMLCVPPVILSYLLAAIVSEFTVPWVPLAMLALLGFFACLPMAIGAVRVAVALYCGGERPLSELFFAFSSYGIYIKALMLGAASILKLGLKLGATSITYVLVGALAGSFLPYFIPAFVATVIGLSAAAAVYVLMDLLLSPFDGTLFYAFADGDVRVIKGIGEAVRNRRGSLRRSLGVSLASPVLIFLSALPLCLPLFLFTLPYLLCRYVYTTAHAADSEITPMIPSEKAAAAEETQEKTTETEDKQEEI